VDTDILVCKYIIWCTSVCPS